MHPTAHCRSLRAVGIAIPETTATLDVSGFQVPLPPRVALSARFAPTLAALRGKLPHPERVHISCSSTLVVNGRDVVIEALDLDGALVINACEGASIGTSLHSFLHTVACLYEYRFPMAVIKSLSVRNAGWEMQLLDPDEPVAEETSMRGYHSEWLISSLDGLSMLPCNCICRYKLVKREAMTLDFAVPGEYVVDNTASVTSD